jgi:hypothetical protein
MRLLNPNCHEISVVQPVATVAQARMRLLLALPLSLPLFSPFLLPEDIQMTNPERQSHGCAEDTTNGAHYFAPCSCCMALAQVRMPSTADGALPTPASNGSGNGKGKGKHKTHGNPIVFKLPALNGRKKQSDEHGAQTRQDDESDQDKAHTDKPDESEAGGSTAKEASSDDWHNDFTVPKKRRLWQGLDGVAVMSFGVVIPVMMALASCMSAPKRITLLLLNHPVETLAELLLAAAIPLAILFIWSSLCKNNVTYSIGRGLLLGAAIGSALIIAGVCVAALFYGSADLESAIGTNFNTGFCWIAFLSVGSAAIGVYLVNRMRLARDFRASRLQVIAFTFIGVLLSIVAFLGAEARPWSIRLAELKAVSNQPAERNAGLQDLRAMDPERELRMECSDARAAGLSGLFMPLKPTSQRELYFAVTGKPYSFREFDNKDISFMPDDDLRRRIVGEKVIGLSLIRSTMDGAVHPQTLSSTINWTFVFKNGTTTPQEVRSELGLPPGAVITGLSLWRHGERQEATVAAAGKAEGFTDSSWRQVNLDSPAIVSDLGHGRMLLHCFPVSQEEEMKVAITMVVPLKPEGAKAASLILPTVIASNFDLKGNNHLVKLHSPAELSSTLKNLKTGLMSGGEKSIAGTLTDEQLESSNLSITTGRTEQLKPIIVLDKMAVALARADEKKRAERIRRNNEYAGAQAERQIIVMIDGSKGVNNQIADVTKALDGKPAGRINRKTLIRTVAPRYVVENVTRVAAPAPKHLVVVVDGSATVKQYSDELSHALAKLPAGIPAELIIASQEKDKLIKPVSLAQGLVGLKQTNFVGGQNNLQAVVNATELAGERIGGAVLWVHGPQPSLNEEIYIMSKFISTPAFYELQVGSGDTDTFDFFKNHSEIGPFTPVPRNTNKLTDDLATFFSKWKPDSNDYAVSLSPTMVVPDGSITVSDQEAEELLALSASRQCDQLVSTRHIRKAARIAVAYGVVTPVSCALISNSPAAIEESIDDGSGASTENAGTQEMSNATRNPQGGPVLQGATNGTIAPQGADATYVQGVNTAGTVRVNNLANLEALLNIFANLGEIGCALAGMAILLHGVVRRESWITDVMGRELEISAGQRVVLGLCLIIFGLAVPGLINWFVASARDANLFS